MAKYDLYPEIKVNQYSGAWRGYPRIVEEIKKNIRKEKTIIAVESYIGVHNEEIKTNHGTDRSNPAGSSLRQHTHLCFYRQRCLSEASDGCHCRHDPAACTVIYLYTLFPYISYG